MNKTLKATALAATAIALSAGAFGANAAPSNDALAASHAKVSLTQAITVAEQHAGGKASQAEFEPSKTGAVYKVEVVNGTQVFDVKVDADKGTLISSAEDTVDHGDDD